MQQTIRNKQKHHLLNCSALKNLQKHMLPQQFSTIDILIWDNNKKKTHGLKKKEWKLINPWIRNIVNRHRIITQPFLTCDLTWSYVLLLFGVPKNSMQWKPKTQCTMRGEDSSSSYIHTWDVLLCQSSANIQSADAACSWK